MPRAYLYTCLLLLMSFASPATAKMNVILIMADDSAADNYGCYGSTFFKSPRLDTLAETGAKFLHAYSTPVCTPSRVKIMTGRSGIRNYSMFGSLDRNEITFGTMMKNAGYATAVAGKWQLHNPPNGTLAPDAGFDTYCLWNYPGTQGSRFWQPSIMQNGKLLQTTEEDYGPDIFTDFLIDFIVENKDRPFFAYYPMVLVHHPFVATPESKSTDESSESKDQQLLYFQDMVAYADKCVGRIVDTLEAHGLRENTVIIYTADNGTDRRLTYPFQEEMRDGQKAWPKDGGTHVPLIVNSPKVVPAGMVIDDLVDFSDFLPTIADITGAELPGVTLDGQSFWPQSQGKSGNSRKWIYQYYYPKFKQAAKAHGQGLNRREIAWVQNQDFKLYRDGTLYATSDRQETNPIRPEQENEAAQSARRMLQEAMDSMPTKAGKLAYDETLEDKKK